jgi:hypothetical protein
MLICLPDEVDGVVDDVAVEGVAVDALLAQLSCTSYINISSFFLHRRFLLDGVKDFQENINLFFNAAQKIPTIQCFNLHAIFEPL